MTLKNLDIDNLFSVGNDELGIHGFHEGTGDITINADAVDIKTQGPFGHGIYSWHSGSVGDTTINANAVDIETHGDSSDGIQSYSEGEGDLNTYVFDSTITTMSQYTNGIFSLIQQGRAGNINVEFKRIDSQSLPTIYTKGRSANGIRAVHQGDGEGETRVVVNNAKIDTEGYSADGVEAWRDGAGGGYGKVYIDISDSEIMTNGNYARAVYGRSTAPIVLDYENDLTIDIRDSTLITNGHSAAGTAALPYTSGLLYINLDNVNRAQSGNPRHPFLRHLG